MHIIRIVTDNSPSLETEPNVEWIFGYGSLMWRPGFPFIELRKAYLPGYNRKPCVYSRHHRGTNEKPGLVLGLDRGIGCVGIAFRIDIKNRSEIIDYLYEREMVGYAYRPAVLTVDIDGDTVTAYTFVADTEHAWYAGNLDEQFAADVIMAAQGISGLNRDYLMNTVAKLSEIGIEEPALVSLAHRVRRLTGMIDFGSGI